MKLNENQQQVIDLLLSDKNVIMIGKAGTGKTMVINELTKVCEQKKIALIKMASTGVAAQHIEGVTLHSAMALDIAPMQRQKKDWPKLRGRIKGSVREIMESYDKTIMVIDEVSMIRADLLDAFLDKISYISYGDITVLLAGDVAQLEPISVITQKGINQDAEAQSRLFTAMDVAYGSSAPFFFKANLLKQFSFRKVELTHVYRQKDAASIAALNIIRSPLPTQRRQVINWVGNNKRKIPLSMINRGSLVLCPTNKGAKQYNEMMLAGLKGKMWHYQVPEGIDMGKSTFHRHLILRPGAVVMLLSNIPEFNLHNGQRGVVKELSKESVLVTFEGGDYLINRGEYGSPSYGMDKDNNIKLLFSNRFEQIPLVLGWAVTIHKSQGTQAKHVHLLNREPLTGKRIPLYGRGTLYVAVSRCTNLKNFTVSEAITASDFNVGMSDFNLSE